MAIEQDLLIWLEATTSLNGFYQHLDSNPGPSFVWFVRSGDDSEDDLGGGGEPDVVFFDVEIYAQSPAAVQAAATALRSQRDYRGNLVPLQDGSFVDDIAITDQADDYTPQANADTLPPYAASFQMAVRGYGVNQ